MALELWLVGRQTSQEAEAQRGGTAETPPLRGPSRWQALARSGIMSGKSLPDSVMSVVLAKVPDAWKLRVVDSLLDAGADPRARNVHGHSALDLAQARSPQNLEALRKRLGPPN